MPYKQTIISTLPNEQTLHFLNREFSVSLNEFIKNLRQSYSDKILDSKVSRTALESRAEIIWASKEDHDAYNEELYFAFPGLKRFRDSYHAEHGIKFEVIYEEINEV